MKNWICQGCKPHSSSNNSNLHRKHKSCLPNNEDWFIYLEVLLLLYENQKIIEKYLLFRTIFEKTKLPTTLMYGGFPVQLTTHIGNPIMRRDGESHLELQSRVRSEVKNLIKANQRETTVMNALTERFPIIKTIKSLTQKQIVLR